MNFTISHAIDIAIQTFAALYAGTPAKVLVLVLALLLCFGGCRLMRWSSALYGVIAGVALGICATSLIPFGQSQVNSLMQSIFAMVIGGVVLGILAFRFRELGIFLVCGCVGVLVAYIPATFIQEFSSVGFWCALLGCGMLFGITGVLFLKPACLLATGFSGIPAGLALTGLLGVSSLGAGILLGCVLTIAGCLVQLYLLRRMEEKAELALQHTDPNLPVVAEEPKEELDDIDKISSRVAEHIGITGSYQTVNFPVSDELETVDDRTMMMPETSKEPEAVETAAEPAAEGLNETAALPRTKEQLVQKPAEPEEALVVEEEQNADVPEETAQFAWAVEETVKESVAQPSEASAEAEPLQQTEKAVPEEEQEPVPKPKKSRGWFFFGKRKKQQEELLEMQLDPIEESDGPSEVVSHSLEEWAEQFAQPQDPTADNKNEAFVDEGSAMEAEISSQPDSPGAEQKKAQSDAEGTTMAEVLEQFAPVETEETDTAEDKPAVCDMKPSVASEPVRDTGEQLSESLEQFMAAAEKRRIEASAEEPAEVAPLTETESLEQFMAAAEESRTESSAEEPADEVQLTETESLEQFMAAAEESQIEKPAEEPDAEEPVEAAQLADAEAQDASYMEQEGQNDTPQALPLAEESEQLFQITEEVVSEEQKPVETKRPFRWIMPVILVLAALAFALVGIQYVELLLALCFAGYVLGHYRSVAFVCAVLCVRRVADLFTLIVRQESWTSVGLSAVSCLCFLVLTIAALRGDSRARHETEE